jgi:excisionase family DNA binding protein
VRTRPSLQLLQLAAPPAAHAPQVVELRVQSETLLLTVEAAAELLVISRSLMYELIRDGSIATIHIGRLRRVRREALTAYIADLAGTSPDQRVTS